MQTLELMGWISTAIAIAGVVMNNRRSRWCFALWLISNSISLTIHVAVGVWSLAARDLAFWALAWHGFYAWTAAKTAEAAKEGE